MILLFTDFGSADLYVGQVKAVLAQHAPAARTIDLLHDAPAYDIKAAAHLLAALASFQPPDCVVMAVVDPGVGGPRQALAVEADGRWYVGPDNGLLSVVGARAQTASYWRITWTPPRLSNSFHGRDLFAPIAAMLAKRERWPDALQPLAQPDVMLDVADRAQVIYIDHYGNAITGIRAEGADTQRMLQVGDHRVRHARVFAEVSPGQAFWYGNSIGLVEIAVNVGSAAQTLGIGLGDAVHWVKP